VIALQARPLGEAKQKKDYLEWFWIPWKETFPRERGEKKSEEIHLIK